MTVAIASFTILVIMPPLPKRVPAPLAAFSIAGVIRSTVWISGGVGSPATGARS